MNMPADMREKLTEIRAVVLAARAVRVAASGEMRACALQELFDAIDALDGVKAVDAR